MVVLKLFLFNTPSCDTGPCKMRNKLLWLSFAHCASPPPLVCFFNVNDTYNTFISFFKCIFLPKTHGTTSALIFFNEDDTSKLF